MTQITTESMVSVVDDHVWTDLAGTAVILHLPAGVYYELNAVGAHIWKLLEQQPHRVSELVSAVVDEYEVERERCADDVIALLRDLQDRGLIAVR